MPTDTEPAADLDARATRRQAGRRVRQVVFIYLLVSALWIMLSDHALEWLTPDATERTRLSILKGWFSVAVPAGALYLLLMHRLVSRTLDALDCEAALQAEGRRATALPNAFVNSSSDPVFAKDIEGRYVLFNPEACRLMKCTESEVLGRDDFSVHPAEAVHFTENDRRVTEGNQVMHCEERLTTAEGERIFPCAKRPMHEADGQVIIL
jgi:two-component system sensor histidine kinase/response regulator